MIRMSVGGEQMGMTATMEAPTTAPAQQIDMMRASGAELDRWFGQLPPGDPPRGFGTGTAIVGSGVARRIGALFARLFLWRGKVFTPDGTALLNVISPFGIRAIRAAVRPATSALDDRPCVLLDYSTTSFVAQWVRDEIRECAPGRYLGMVYVRGRKIPVRFALDFTKP
jgi:hypothetical protein